MEETGCSSSASSRMSSSQTISSGIHVQAELLNEIATLRSALAQSHQQLEKAHAAGYVNGSSGRLTPVSALHATVRRDRRVSMPVAASPRLNNIHNNAQSRGSSTAGRSRHDRSSLSSTSQMTSNSQRHRRNSSAVVGSTSSSPDNNQQTQTRAATTPATASSIHSTPRSASIVGYAGAAPSSLATPTASASVPAFSLRRDTAYDDLAKVMNAPSPNVPSRILANSSNANALGISSPPSAPHRRATSLNNSSSSSSHYTATNSTGTPTSASKMPMIPPGSVGTATTLAGGSNSPKTPLSADKSTFDGTPIRSKQQQSQLGKDDGIVPNGILRDATNGAVRSHEQHQSTQISARGSEGDDDHDEKQLSTLHLPPLPSANGQNIPPPPGMRSPHLSSDGEGGDYSPTTTIESADNDDLLPRMPSRRQSKSSNGASARGGSSPFFGGSAGFTERHAARIASSQSGTSKVIMSLQTELTNSRAQLESTRTQLRASARAVESLTRQIEDLKEGKERSRLELQGMSTTLTRRERMLEETLARARTAESQLKQLEEEKKAHYGECGKRLKELEGRCKEAEERRAKAESEYAALRGASSSLAGDFAKEIKALKKELHSARLKSDQDRNEARQRQQSVTKLLTSRTSVTEDVNTTLQDLRTWQTTMQKQYQDTISALSRQYVQSQAENEALTKRTQEVVDELRQYKNAMRAYDTELSTSQS